MTGPRKPTRRRFLLSLAAGLPLAACARVGGTRSIEGRIVGPSRELGHRLRDAVGVPDKALPSPEPARVVIAGGGVAGLATAWALERAGFRDFVLLELESAAGGTACWGSNDVSAYPWGAHYVPTPRPDNRALIAMLEETGAVERYDGDRPIWSESVLCRAPQERIFRGGVWHEGLYPGAGALPEDLAQLETFQVEMRRWAGWRDASGRRAFEVPRAEGSDAAEVRALDELSAAEYLDGLGFDSPRLRWLVEYACRDDFGARLDQTSAWAAVHYHASRLDPDTGEAAPFLTWPEGNGRLIRHLEQLVGPRLRTGHLVRRIVPEDDGAIVNAFDATTSRTVRMRAEHVVVALPRFVAGRVVAPWVDDPPAHLAEAVYTPWAVANLTLRGRPEEHGFGPSWDNVLYDSKSLGYVVATHQSGRDHGPTVWTWYRPYTDDDVAATRRELERRTWDDWAAEILDDLRTAHPDIAERVERIDVMVWAHAMVRPRPGYLWSEALARSAAPIGRVRFAHTDLSGVALFEEAWYWGVRAAEEILRSEGQTFQSWLET